MSEPTQTPEPTDPVTLPVADPTNGDSPPADDEFTSERQKRRFAELTGRVGKFARERDEAHTRIEMLQWREVERIAGATLSVPADVRLEAPKLADLVDPETGDVDPELVAAAVEALAAKRPGLRKPPEVRPLPGAHGLRVPPQKPTFAETVADLTRGRI
jgi:hypothetical protein